MPSPDYDLIVIGGGPAGTSGANAAAIFGKRVALVEKAAHLGGAGIHTGTVPSKALRESALVISGWRARKLVGIDFAVHRDATVADFMRHETEVRDAICTMVESRLKKHRVERFGGRAAFVDPRTVRVTDAAGRETLLQGGTILVATGSSPVHPQEFPFAHPRVHDSDEILRIAELPRRLAVVGAGVIGAEYASTFAALGVEVHLIDGRDTLLSFLDPELSQAVEDGMRRLGVRFHWRQSVTSCAAPASGDVVLTFASGATLAVTDVLVAAGRSSNTADLDLAAAGIAPGQRGLIPVNAIYQSEVPHIYAAGDVIGPPALAATGMEQARIAMCHAFDLLKKELAPILPTGIYTIPEASTVGQTEPQVKEAGVSYIVGRARYADNARGQIVGDESGLLKLIFRRDDLRLLGAHAVGEQATELIHIALMAMLCEGDAELFNRACFNYPTLGDLYKHATYDAMLQKLGQPPERE